MMIQRNSRRGPRRIVSHDTGKGRHVPAASIPQLGSWCRGEQRETHISCFFLDLLQPDASIQAKFHLEHDTCNMIKFFLVW